MKIRSLPALLLALSAVALAGCGGSGVVAVAPGGDHQLVRHNVSGGQYVLYRGTGFDEMNRPRRIEEVWRASVPDRSDLGFQWTHNKQTMYEPDAALHLVAIAGPDRRDLGPLRQQTEKYFWADANANVGAYWQGQGARTMFETVTLQK